MKARIKELAQSYSNAIEEMHAAFFYVNKFAPDTKLTDLINAVAERWDINAEYMREVIACASTAEEVAQKQIEDAARKDADAAKRDCKNGIYDKWYRYNRNDDGAAYDKAWMEQNKETQNEKVEFLNA